FQLSAVFRVMRPSRELVETFWAWPATGLQQRMSRVRFCPETSSITTRWGSFSFQNCAERLAANAPATATATARAICANNIGSIFVELKCISDSIEATNSAHDGIIARTSPAR